ncbi:hypothetical protein PQI07_16480 [Methylobacterium sp. 092160098-2]|uniref:hypothetical protein n=1 Tax=Methylobacterium sp. 092160098-2 TaxID=3025129 RepID=UPI002381C026|nr:hypothetical protein [Methylobacterium sp. 092160098-2]MDE4912279.1 hypothetical protein [Methylobacterium sp. 092160098-2]
MTISLIEPVRPERLILINRRLVSNRIELRQVDEGTAAAAVLFTYQLERELLRGLIEPELAVRKASVLCRAACFTHPERMGGVS